MEMGSVFMARTPGGVRCMLTDPRALEFLLANGCQLRLDPASDPRAAAMDVLEQGIEKGVIIAGSVFPIGLQVEGRFFSFVASWCVQNNLTADEMASVMSSADSAVYALVDSLMRYRVSNQRDAVVWIEEEYPSGHPRPDVVDLWSARNDEQDFSYSHLASDVERSLSQALA